MRNRMKKIMFLLLVIFLSTACQENLPTQDDTPEIDFQYLCGYRKLDKYETHSKSNNNTMVLTYRLDGSMGIIFDADGSLQIMQNDTLQASGNYTILERENKIKLSELLLAEGVTPEGTAQLIFPVISNNTLQVDKLTRDEFVITLKYDSTTDMVAYFSI